jgi:cardiolipin synthase
LKFIPNLITSLRFILAAVFAHNLKKRQYAFAAFTTLAAALSDLFDGMLARRFSWQSNAGALLDPIADKAFEITCIRLLNREKMLPGYYSLIFLTRNLLQLLSIPLLTLIFPRSFKVKPNLTAKAATAFTFAVILLALMNRFFDKNHFFKALLKFLTMVSSTLELLVLKDYLPRLLQIINGTHDTFE